MVKNESNDGNKCDSSLREWGDQCSGVLGKVPGKILNLDKALIDGWGGEEQRAYLVSCFDLCVLEKLKITAL